MHSKTPLPHNFRKLTFPERTEAMKRFCQLSEGEIALISGKVDLSDLADVLVESSIGTFPVPFGLATGFLINGTETIIPMATEEPSVIAAASFGAMLAKSGGGFTTKVNDPIMTGQIFLYDSAPDTANRIRKAHREIQRLVDALIPSMKERGGGFIDLDVEQLSPYTFCVNVHIDVREAMGANVVNTVAEGLKSKLAELTDGNILMAVLTNAAEHRLAKAFFQIPLKYFHKGNLKGEEICRRIVMAADIGNTCPTRAVTHNKGIMNGISALALATGNDTRALEAAAHFHAQKSGAYRTLTTYHIENDSLHGSIELPIPMGTVGGSTSIWTPSNLSLKILGNPNSATLSGIAASLGLAQNLAALFALVTDGIQNGHMKLHAARIAYSIGARGEEVRPLAEKLWEENALNESKARAIYDKMKGKP